MMLLNIINRSLFSVTIAYFLGMQQMAGIIISVIMNTNIIHLGGISSLSNMNYLHKHMNNYTNIL